MTKPTKWVCAQRILRSAWASAQSDQSLRCPHEETLGTELPIERTAKTDQTGRMPRLILVFAGRTVILLVLSYRGRSVRVAERLALPTSDHGVAGSNPAGGEILPEPKRRFIAQSLSCSPFHRLEMTEILLKGRKTLSHPSIHHIAAHINSTLFVELKGNHVIYGPRQSNLVLIAYASSEGSGEPAHPRSLARTSAALSYKQWVKRNLQTESQIPAPSEWLGMRS